jgi:hypothetical protein
MLGGSRFKLICLHHHGSQKGERSTTVVPSFSAKRQNSEFGEMSNDRPVVGDRLVQ